MPAIARFSEGLLTPPRYAGAPFRLPPATARLCQGVRLLIVGVLLWRFGSLIRYGLNKDGIVSSLRDWDKIDISGVGNGQLFALVVLNLVVIFGLQLGIYGSLFQLFSGFLRGEVFARVSGLRLRRAGLFVLAFILAGPLRNTLAVALLTAHLPGGARWMLVWWDVSPLYDFILGSVGFVLGQVFVVAAEMAADNESIL